MKYILIALSLTLAACGGSGGSSSGSGGSTSTSCNSPQTCKCFKSAREWKDNHQKLHRSDEPPWSKVRQGWHNVHGADINVCYPDAKPDKCKGSACGQHIRPS